jgi:hypothetical protein
MKGVPNRAGATQGCVDWPSARAKCCPTPVDECRWIWSGRGKAYWPSVLASRRPRLADANRCSFSVGAPAHR